MRCALSSMASYRSDKMPPIGCECAYGVIRRRRRVLGGPTGAQPMGTESARTTTHGRRQVKKTRNRQESGWAGLCSASCRVPRGSLTNGRDKADAKAIRKSSWCLLTVGTECPRMTGTERPRIKRNPNAHTERGKRDSFDATGASQCIGSTPSWTVMAWWAADCNGWPSL
jgi:hypothetical protein